MERVYFTERNGKRILVQDLSGSRDIKDSIAIFDRAEELVKREPPASVRLLTDISGAHYTTEAVDRLKSFSQSVTPWMVASAAVGVSGIKRIVLHSLIRLSGRHIKIFDTVDQALDWLSQQ